MLFIIVSTIIDSAASFTPRISANSRYFIMIANEISDCQRNNNYQADDDDDAHDHDHVDSNCGQL